jgi:hypothetical protein
MVKCGDDFEHFYQCGGQLFGDGDFDSERLHSVGDANYYSKYDRADGFYHQFDE